MEKCPICESSLSAGTTKWLWKCQNCLFLKSTLEPDFSSSTDSSPLDEEARAHGLNSLRDGNFRQILSQLSQAGGKPGQKLLDVGCAHGWFLDAAKKEGYLTFGVEPETKFRDHYQKAGHQVWNGLFPQCLPEGSKFDVIVFNDVFEHLPDVHAAAESCSRFLNPGGFLVLNIPSSRGVFYKAAVMLNQLGIKGPLERMWQIHFPSPHLSYFRPEHLPKLMARHHFRVVSKFSLESIKIKGLWSRLRYDKNSSVLYSGIVYLGVFVLSPMLKLLPSDIVVEVFQLSPQGE